MFILLFFPAVYKPFAGTFSNMISENTDVNESMGTFH